MDKDELKARFIQKAQAIHGDKYDYSKVEYVNCKTKVCIVCPKHGEFWQTPDNHLQGNECQQCAIETRGNKKRHTTEKWVEMAKAVHGEKYDYSKVSYSNSTTKVCIVCPKHGEFWQTPSSHLQGCGCPSCKGEKVRIEQTMPFETFVERARQIHGEKYDYSHTHLHGANSKAEIFCRDCGNTFKQTPHSHLSGRGCPYCAHRLLTTESAIKLAQLVHGDKYDYSKVEYTRMKEKVCIICPKHGEFWQSFDKHLRKHGCPHCKASHLEEDVRLALLEHGVDFEYDSTQPWLNGQRFDFYLNSLNIAIECQGIQHFKPTAFGPNVDAKELFDKVHALDVSKLEKAKENGVPIIYYSDLGYKTFLGEEIVSNSHDLIQVLKTLGLPFSDKFLVP